MTMGLYLRFKLLLLFVIDVQTSSIHEIAMVHVLHLILRNQLCKLELYVTKRVLHRFYQRSMHCHFALVPVFHAPFVLDYESLSDFLLLNHIISVTSWTCIHIMSLKKQ